MTNKRRKILANEKIGDRVSIFQRGQIWQANFQEAGRQRRQSSKNVQPQRGSPTAIRLEAELQDGLYKRHKDITIDDAIDLFMASQEDEGKSPKTLVKDQLVARRVRDLAARRNARNLSQLDLSFVDQFRSEAVEPETSHEDHS